MKLKVKIRWYDLWMGAYIKPPKRGDTILHIYICPLPCLVLHLQFRRRHP